MFRTRRLDYGRVCTGPRWCSRDTRAACGSPARLVHRATSPEPYGVYVVRAGKAHFTPIALGFAGEELEVSGVEPDDLIVMDPSKLQGTAVPVVVKQGRAPR